MTDVGWGYSLGATLTPFSGTSIGIGFRSAIDEELDGEFQHFGIPITAKVVLPEMVSLGLSQRITDAFTLNATAEWTNWSRLQFPRVRNDLTGGLLAPSPFLPLAYDDGWFFSVGGEYVVNPAWALRAGVAYEISPIDTGNRNPRLPDSDRIWALARADLHLEPVPLVRPRLHAYFHGGQHGHQYRTGQPDLPDARRRVRGECRLGCRHHLGGAQSPLGQSGPTDPGARRAEIVSEPSGRGGPGSERAKAVVSVVSS